MRCTLQVDVYAFAMIAFELFEGWLPFQGEKPIVAARRAASDGLRPSFSAQNRWALLPFCLVLSQPCGLAWVQVFAIWGRPGRSPLHPDLLHYLGVPSHCTAQWL